MLLGIGLVLLSSFLEAALACNGYSLKVNSYKNCIDNGIMQFPTKGGGAVLDKECNIILYGCLDVIKTFNKAEAKYTINKSPLPPMEGTIDLCQAAKEFGDNPVVTKTLEMFGVPKQCPFPAKKICSGPTKKINISKYKNQIGMASGNVKMKIEIEHDVGNTCLEADITISKNKNA